jgi:hypothetical protein
MDYDGWHDRYECADAHPLGHAKERLKIHEENINLPIKDLKGVFNICPST